MKQKYSSNLALEGTAAYLFVEKNMSHVEDQMAVMVVTVVLCT